MRQTKLANLVRIRHTVLEKKTFLWTVNGRNVRTHVRPYKNVRLDGWTPGLTLWGHLEEISSKPPRREFFFDFSFFMNAICTLDRIMVASIFPTQHKWIILVDVKAEAKQWPSRKDNCRLQRPFKVERTCPTDYMGTRRWIRLFSRRSDKFTKRAETNECMVSSVKSSHSLLYFSIL